MVSLKYHLFINQHQFFSELFTSQKRISHGVTANSFTYPFHHTKLTNLVYKPVIQIVKICLLKIEVYTSFCSKTLLVNYINVCLDKKILIYDKRVGLF